MKNYKNLLLLVCFFCVQLSIAQTYKVIAVEGEAFVTQVRNGKNHYAKIVFGPLPEGNEVILKKNAVVKFINSNNELSTLDKEGNYKLDTISFDKPKESSMFDKFCNYFHDFFVNHSSAESKVYYKNSIYAISRGNMTAPQLDFPLTGQFPALSGPIPFEWSHACDTCEYIFTIYDYESRKSVFAWTTKEQRLTLDNSNRYLIPDKTYYWTVTMPGIDLEYNTQILEMTKPSEYESKVAELSMKASSSPLMDHYLPRTLFIISEFQSQGFDNYAIYYGLQQRQLHPSDEILANLIERLWYDQLIDN